MKIITYIDIMPHDIQNTIWYFVHNNRLEDLHIQLLSEITNDIPPSKVLIYNEPTLYMKKLHEVMEIFTRINDYGYDVIISKSYKYLIWYLIKYYTTPPKDTTSIIGEYTERGNELYQYFNNMNSQLHRMTFNIQTTREKNYLTLIELENKIPILTFQELFVLNIFLSNIIGLV
jgi:hypothetical protein